MKALLRRRVGIVGLLLVLAGLVSACSGAKAQDQVHVLTYKGEVNPVMERYIDRGISTAERSHARAVVLRLDTPGGQDGAMRDIVQRIESSTVPVIVYVSPSGGRAASAGTFITMAGNLAAMAPNTSIGAATPINSNGDDIPGALGRKVTNDAVSYIRGIADLRSRNADWAESAVRDAVSATDKDAVSLNIVDFVATSLPDLLAQSNGRQVEVKTADGGTQQVKLATGDAAVYQNNETVFEQVLNVIATPDIAFILLNIGGLFLLFEVFHPNVLGGVIGIICLMFGFFALGSLPTNWAGVGLIVFGFILMALEVHVAGFGILGVGGVVSLLLGGLILTSGNDTGVEVSRWLVIAIGAAVGAFILLFLGSIVRARRMPAYTGRERLVGAVGKARTVLDPTGYVYIQGERWEAEAEDAPLYEGTPVVVTSVQGIRLTVKRDPASIILLPAAGSGAPPARSATA
ncbi:MAG TPA: nodulation protein NfeD [Dehalococcoidia bacterium]|jgi:membrane-bound serine protease (ClpP class)